MARETMIWQEQRVELVEKERPEYWWFLPTCLTWPLDYIKLDTTSHTLTWGKLYYDISNFCRKGTNCHDRNFYGKGSKLMKVWNHMVLHNECPSELAQIDIHMYIAAFLHNGSPAALACSSRQYKATRGTRKYRNLPWLQLGHPILSQVHPQILLGPIAYLGTSCPQLCRVPIQIK